MLTTLQDNQSIKNKVINSLSDSVTFEYDNEVKEYCVFFNELSGYYGQWKTKEVALLELLSWYLDTCNC